MKTAKQVDQLIADLKAAGTPLQDIAWKTALACVGWPYIFGDRGQNCTPAHRRAAYASKGEEHPTIKSKCKNFQGTGSCSGCKFYPGGKTRAFDCRGFTYWVLLQIYGWKLQGAGATSQWNTASNWKAKGEVSDGIPRDTIVCLFYYKKDKNGKRTKTLEHTGFYYNGETCECSNGVQHFTTLNKKWEVWGVPACVDGEVKPEPAPDPGTPTIKKGSKGEAVKKLQTILVSLGYDLGKNPVDGEFGTATAKAVKAFQQANGLEVDGIVGPKTWAALLQDPVEKVTVTIPGLMREQANALITEYPNGYINA